MTEGPILLVDGDLLIYRTAAACEREVWWDEQNIILQTNVEQAWDTVQAVVSKLKERLHTDQIILTFSDGRSFRYDILDTYKYNREGKRKPLGYWELFDRAKATYETKSFPRLEADDVMGILATKPMKARRIIVSDDKDMRTIPGWLFRQGKLEQISEVDADCAFMTQTLIGDTADGYAGLPGCGPKTAQKLIQAALDENAHLCGDAIHCIWPAVVAAYEAKGLTEDDALTQARLARILRWGDWDSERKEPKLWLKK